MNAQIRPWSTADAPNVLAASVVPDLIRQIRLPVPGIDGALAWVCGRMEADPLKLCSFAIELDGELAGEVALHGFVHEHAVATVGYWLMPDARGRGLATRATCTMVTWAFDELGMERVGLDHRVNNPESGRVAARCGFQYEGIERSRLGYDGQRFDIARYGRLISDPTPDVELLAFCSS